MNLTIEPAIQLLTKNDFDLYRNIRLDSLINYPDNSNSTYDEEVNSKELKLAHVFSDTITNDFIYGAFVDSELIGICGFMQETKTKTRHLGELTQMYVKSAYGGRGIGMMLVKATLEKAFSDNTIEQIKLTVIAQNKNAVSLYKRAGFVEYGIFENYYKTDDKYQTETFMLLPRSEYLNGKNLNNE
jgi:ribosomal protein S18 acetylase RimI-like enzyme